MALDPKARNALYLLLGLAVLAAIPIGLKWADKRDDSVTRLAREKRAAKDAVAEAARKDLACEAIEIREPGGELWAHGCGKRGRYLPTADGTYLLAGKVEPEEGESGCVTKWTHDADAGGSAREVAAAIHAGGKPVRIRIPISAFGVSGLAKLRYGEQVDVFVETDAGALGETVPVPCIDPAADGGVREGKCDKAWDAVAEISECR